MAAYTAWYRGHKRWSQEDFKKDPHIRKVLVDYPFLHSACDAVSEWGARELNAGRQLEKELRRWQNAYQQSAWHRVTSVILEVKPNLQLAATGIPSADGCPVALTVLPKTTGRCLLIATILEDATRVPWLTQTRRRKAARQAAAQWAEKLEEPKPSTWLPTLAQLCEFLYVSPHDYYNDEIITGEERTEIERAMSRKTPTLRL